eukprot:PLAT9900.1.p1 GENE.PLAT9900.1~~PLAT9900.1.p1  ORF type:complete len:243 (-),score=76.10 PLAT9900.1:35-763(-)
MAVIPGLNGHVVASSAACCLAVFAINRDLIWRGLLNSERQLGRVAQSCMSGLHSAASVAACCLALVTERHALRDLVLARSSIARLMMNVDLGYLLVDTALDALQGVKPSLLLHHLVMAGGALAVLWTGKGEPLYLLFSLSNLTTVFMALRVIAVKTHQPASVKGMLQAVIAVLWVLLRVAMPPAVLQMFAKQRGLSSLLQLPWHIPIKCSVLTGFFYLLQVRWFMKGVRLLWRSRALRAHAA